MQISAIASTIASGTTVPTNESDGSPDQDNPFKCSMEETVLKEVCKIENGLQSFGLPESSKAFTESIQQNSTLESLKPQSKESVILRSQSVNFNKSAIQLEEVDEGSQEIQGTEETNPGIYLEITFMEPTTTLKYTHMATFVVPANFTLADLAHEFDCPCKNITIEDQESKGSFFFFENIFYNDCTVDQDLSQYVLYS